MRKQEVKFNPKALRVEFYQFLFKNPEVKKLSPNAQLGKAVEAGVMTYTEMVRYRDFEAAEAKKKLEGNTGKKPSKTFKARA